MKFSWRAVLLALGVLNLLLGTDLTAQVAAPRVTAIRAGRLLDPEGGRLLSNQIIIVEGTRIREVGSAVAIPAEAELIDLSNATVMPGLVEAHNHLALTYKPIPENNVYYYTYVQDSTALRAIQAASNGIQMLADDRRRLRRLSETDDLTGLYNLRGFEARLRAMLRQGRADGTAVAVLVFDVDRLKSINDTHGHLAGADAVRTVGRIVGECMTDGAIGCRFGGDEFVVALPGCDVDAAGAAAQALRQAVFATAPTLAGLAFPAGTLSISVGLACDPRRQPGPRESDEGVAAQALFRAADQALYVAKGAGRNQVRSA